MRHFVLAALIGLLAALLTGCAGRRTEAKLQKSNRLTINYLLKRSERAPGQSEEVSKSLVISKPDEVQKIVKTLRVTGAEALEIPIYVGCDVIFGFEDGSSTHAWFLRPTQFQAEGTVIRLRDSSFYDKICEAISRAEGKPTDPLADFGGKGAPP